MATISSHVLNSVDGTHAGGVRVQCWRILDSGARESVFDVRSGEDGRIGATVDVDADGVPPSAGAVIALTPVPDSAGLAVAPAALPAQGASERWGL